ncbi:hypothetical protein A2U01_0062579, partial [Trifolium medium]|nr:hypothetical protein [Trifolium medium]
EGIEVRTDEASAKRSGLFNILFFQEARRDCILSIIKWKSLLLPLPLSIGNPRYLSKDVVLPTPEIDVSLLILAWGVPVE